MVLLSIGHGLLGSLPLADRQLGKSATPAYPPRGTHTTKPPPPEELVQLGARRAVE